jgi:hypothetical protein
VRQKQKKKKKKQQKQIKMNNKPITARVKSGMFKTKEPLLNVGPAGVDGNNTTRTMPSPSKMKGYKMKSSPFKQAKTTDDIVTEAIDDQITDQGISLGTIKTTNTTGSGGTEGTPDVITEPTEIFTGEKATGEKAKEWAKQNEYCKGKPKGTPGCSGFHKYEGGALEKGTEGTPGTDDKEVKEKTAIIEKVARTGEASSAYATRNNLRKAKVAARNAKKYQRKKDKANRRKHPELYDAKEQRRARKEAAADSIKKVADSELRNAQIQSKQGKYGFGANKDIVLDDVNRQQGELPDTRQRELGTPVEMNKPGFFKKKSPMKMKYFKK